MQPVLGLGLGDLQYYTSSYRFFLILAAAATVGVGFAVAARRRMPWGQVLICLVAMAAAVPMGARAWDAATKAEPYSRDPGLLLRTDLAGLSLYGGLLLAMVVGLAACRLVGVDPVRLADSVAPALGVGIALARLGCFEAGCCFGREANLPWAVVFPTGSEAHLYQILSRGGLLLEELPLPVHATQLYEAAAALVGAAVAARFLRRQAPAGAAFLAFVLVYDGFRLANHPLRAPASALSVPDWFYPLLYALVLAATALLLWLRLRCSSRIPGALI